MKPGRPLTHDGRGCGRACVCHRVCFCHGYGYGRACVFCGRRVCVGDGGDGGRGRGRDRDGGGLESGSENGCANGSGWCRAGDNRESAIGYRGPFAVVCGLVMGSAK